MKKLILYYIFTICIVSIGKTQSVEWAKHIGGMGNEMCADMETGPSGKIYLTGSSGGVSDFDPGPGTTSLPAGPNIYIAKYDTNGSYIWVKSIAEDINLYSTDIAIDKDENIVITGTFNGTVDFDPGTDTANLTSVPVTKDIFIAKYDSSGNYLWAWGFGGSSIDNADDVAIDTAGNVIFTAIFRDTVDFDPGPGIANLDGGAGSGVVAKYDNNGNYLWAMIMPVGNALTVDINNNILITGPFSGTVDLDPGPGIANFVAQGFYRDVFIVKYDPNGNYMMATALQGPDTDEGFGIITDASNNIIVTGRFKDSIDLDPGIPVNLWVSNGNMDMFIAKFDVNLNFLWGKGFGGNAMDFLYDVTTDVLGNIAVTGYFRDTVDFDPSAGENIIISNDEADIFISKFDYAGNYLWTHTMGGYYLDYGVALETDIEGKILAAGHFYDSIDIKPGADTAYFATPSSTYDIYLIKYGDSICSQIVDTSVTKNGDTLIANVTGATYQWLDCDSGYSAIGGATSQSYIPATTGNYAVEVTQNGCLDTSLCYTITITGCASTASTINPTTCKSYTVPSGDETYIASGTYMDTIPNSAGCDSIITMNLTIVTVASSFSASDTSICPGGAVTFINTSMGATNYTWQNDGTTFSNSPDTVWQLFFMSGGTISLIANDSVTGCNDTSYFTVQVVPGPNPNLSIFIFGLDSNYCSNDNAVTLTGSPVGGTFSGNGISSFLFDPAVAGVGTHAITYTLPPGPGSCSAFTYSNVVVDVCTGVKDIGNDPRVIVYPNPFSNETTLRFSNPRGVKHTFYLHDVLGREVKRIEDIRSDKLIFKRGNLSGGIYIYQLEGDKRIIATGKLIINI